MHETMSVSSEHILKTFEKRRTKLGMSKAELARRMGLDAVTVGNMLLGKRQISVDEAMSLCAVLDICPQDLMAPDTAKLHRKYWG